MPAYAQPINALTLAAIRKRAQRAVPVSGSNCAECGCDTSLTRHHFDYSKPEEVRIICRSCHQKMHWREDWKDKRVQPAKCIVCGAEFQPKRSRRAKVCGKSCSVQLGKSSAAKRWQTGRTG
jgi:hypothetical protein